VVEHARTIIEHKKTLEENNQLINHLNKQLTDRTSGLKMQPSFAGSALAYPMTRVPFAAGMTGMGVGTTGVIGVTTYNTETTISGSYQGTSRLRNSTSPLGTNTLEKTTERINP